jgi:drug/metabolite transporter (DMT)-like permease
MDSQLAPNVLNSETTKIVAQRLWPSMLFLIAMALISIFALAFFTESNTLSRSIGFWIWFSFMMGITVVGCIVFMMDARILNSADRVANTGGQ